MVGKRTLPERTSRNTVRQMKPRSFSIMAIAACLLSACSYRAETLPRCLSHNVDSSLRAVKKVTDSGAYPGGVVELEHRLCSTHDDKLAIAERLLTASGYSFERHAAELGDCTDVTLKSPLTTPVLRKQVTTFCQIAAAAGVAYTGWSGSIGSRFLFVSGDYISL